MSGPLPPGARRPHATPRQATYHDDLVLLVAEPQAPQRRDEGTHVLSRVAELLAVLYYCWRTPALPPWGVPSSSCSAGRGEGPQEQARVAGQLCALHGPGRVGFGCVGEWFACVRACEWGVLVCVWDEGSGPRRRSLVVSNGTCSFGAALDLARLGTKWCAGVIATKLVDCHTWQSSEPKTPLRRLRVVVALPSKAIPSIPSIVDSCCRCPDTHPRPHILELLRRHKQQQAETHSSNVSIAMAAAEVVAAAPPPPSASLR